MPCHQWTPPHICSVDSIEGSSNIPLRWTMEGTHTGYGSLGAPTGRSPFVMGILIGGRVVEEWTLCDELALRVKGKLPV